MEESRTKNAKRNILFGALNKVIQLGLPFVLRTAIIYKLGATYLGLGSLFTSILQVLNMAELGFSSTIVFSLYKPLADNDTNHICALMALYKKIYHIVGIIILIGGLLLMPFLPKLIKGSYPQEINIFILYLIYLINTVISYFAFAYKSVLLVASQRQDIISNIEAILSIIKGILQFWVLLFFKNFYAYVVCMIIYTLLYNFCVNMVTRKKFPEYICKGIIDKSEKENIKRQVGGLAIGKLCLTTRNSFDNIVLSLFCGLIDVAIYSNYFYVLTAVQGLTGVILQGISAGIGNSVATESREKNYIDFKKFYFYFSWISSWCSICMLCLYQPFMTIWVGKELTASFSVAILFTVYFYITQLGQIRALYNNAAGIWWELRYSAILEIFANLLLNFVLGYFFGMKGIVGATIITVFIFSICYATNVTYRVYFKESVIDYFRMTLLYLFITSFAGITTYLLVFKINTGIVLDFAIRLIICVIVPNIVILCFALCIPFTRRYLRDFVITLKKK